MTGIEISRARVIERVPDIPYDRSARPETPAASEGGRALSVPATSNRLRAPAPLRSESPAIQASPDRPPEPTPCRPLAVDNGIERQVAWQPRQDPWALRLQNVAPMTDASAQHGERGKGAADDGEGLLKRLIRKMIESYGRLFSPPTGRFVDVCA